MKICDLNKKYDKLQKEYGALELNSIYNGGLEEEPDVCFVFMNPTGRNVASLKSWKGKRYPWLGTKNIWKLFYSLNLIDKNIYDNIMSLRPKDWTEEFADIVYNNVKKHKIFITNLGKCTQIDARPLPDIVYKQYLDLLYKEIEIIKPKKIVTFGNQVSTIFLDEVINVSKCRKKAYLKKIKNVTYSVYPTYYPVGNGMRNIDLAIEDLRYILNN